MPDPLSTRTNLVAGVGGARRHAAVAIARNGHILAACEQERVVRRRGIGADAGFPHEALHTCLAAVCAQTADLVGFSNAEPTIRTPDLPVLEQIEHHRGHASSAYLTSSFSDAATVVCDTRPSREVSVWAGADGRLVETDWGWEGPGLATMYSTCCRIAGIAEGVHEDHFEALARLHPFPPDDLPVIGRYDGNRFELVDGWPAHLEEHYHTRFGSAPVGSPESSRFASTCQQFIGRLLLEFLTDVRRRTGQANLCLGGGLFRNTFFNSLVRRSGLFENVFVPMNPANPGLALGCALASSGATPEPCSPFLGPSYSAEDTKLVLDNCKLRYDMIRDSELLNRAVDVLRRGGTVAWFQDRMEFGPRALGHRSILADPLNPFVLTNLNRFLKQRPAWRTYALSGPSRVIAEHFDGPSESEFMECDFSPRDRSLVRHLAGVDHATFRVQTLDSLRRPSLFLQLHEAFGAASGLPLLVNTSFNGFHEPIVCDPRDAVRVFYGTGLDALAIGPFWLEK